MSERAPRRERQDAVINRARILATAQDLFTREGVENVSMNRIAQEAEVGAGTLYRHFANKSELCFWLLQDQITVMADELNALVDACDSDARATFEAMVVRYLRFREQKKSLFRGMERTASHDGGPTQSPVYETLRAPFVKLFEQAAGAEGASDSADPVFRADMLLGTLIGGSFQYQQSSRGFSKEDFAAQLCAVFCPRA